MPLGLFNSSFSTMPKSYTELDLQSMTEHETGLLSHFLARVCQICKDQGTVKKSEIFESVKKTNLRTFSTLKRYIGSKLVPTVLQNLKTMQNSSFQVCI